MIGAKARVDAKPPVALSSQPVDAALRKKNSGRKGKECELCTLRNDQDSKSSHWRSQRHTQEQQQAVIKLIIRLIWIFLFFSLLRISKHAN